MRIYRSAWKLNHDDTMNITENYKTSRRGAKTTEQKKLSGKRNGEGEYRTIAKSKK